uniref:TLDc domain-containing protein n=1 Tax=Globodera pallida TaxID=36090 RepID=A0A183CNF1_GLOPA
MSAPRQSTNSFMVRVYDDLYTCSASFKRTLEPTCDEGRYWHSGLQQAFYFIDIHDAVCIMDASRKARLGHPFEVIDLTQDDECADPIIDLTDEEDCGLWKGNGTAEDPFVLDDGAEFVLVARGPSDMSVSSLVE